MNLNLVYIGDMERGGFFNRSQYQSKGWNIFEVKENEFFHYGIYTHDPLFLQFDETGNIKSHQNIKVNEIGLLDSLISKN
jgi:hypothetical protein